MTFFFIATKHSIHAFFNSVESNLPTHLPTPGSILALLEKNPVLRQKFLDLLQKHKRELPRIVNMPGIPYAVAHSLLTIPMSALMSGDSSVVQKCKPSIADEAHNILEALRFRWVDSGCISVGSIKTEVPPEYLPTVEFLVELLKLLKLE